MPAPQLHNTRINAKMSFLPLFGCPPSDLLSAPDYTKHARAVYDFTVAVGDVALAHGLDCSAGKFK